MPRAKRSRFRFSLERAGSQAEATTGTDMTCPKCNAAMTAITVGEYEVDRCTDCGGLWFDLREHEHIAESKADVERLDLGDPSKAARWNEQREIECPVCHVKMLKLSVPNQLHIKYESCPVCYGAFFDAGELKDFASHTLAEQVSGFFRGFRWRQADQ
jgi:Zn-finger nucleic acid-binding protein